MSDLKTKISVASAGAILAPFLVMVGFSLDDVKLTDGNEFKNQEAYVEYRDGKLADRDIWSINEFYTKSREMAAIYEYEIKKNNITFSLAEVRGMEGTDVRSKIGSKLQL